MMKLRDQASGRVFLQGTNHQDRGSIGGRCVEGIRKRSTTNEPYKFNHNGRAVIFNGNISQTITGVMDGPDRFGSIVVTNGSDVIHTAAMAANSNRHWAISDDGGDTFDVDLIFQDETLASNSEE